MSPETFQILFIEDDSAIVDLLGKMLSKRRAPRFELESAGALAAGLKRLGEEEFHAVLLDLGLPDSSGLNTFDAVHKMVPRTPIVILTGLADEATTTEAISRGAQDYLLKTDVTANALAKSLSYAIERNRLVLEMERHQENLEALVEKRSAELRRANEVLQEELVRRRQVEESLLERERFLSATFAAIQDGMSVLNPDLTILRVNDVAKRWFGGNPELERKKCYDYFHGRSKACDPCPTLRCLRSRQAESEIVPGLPGSPIEWIELFSYPIVDKDSGEVTGVVEFFRDITQRRKAAEVLRESREQYRLLASHLERIREEERTRMAREIHDELGQALTALKMDLSWLAARMPEDSPLLAEKLQDMTTVVKTTSTTVKRMASELRPGLLDDLGIGAAAEWQLQEFQQRTGIPCEAIIEPEDMTLDPERSTALFRVLQEALTNIARHANASAVRVTLRETDGGVEMTIRDNGVGIAPEQVSHPRSWGIIGMRERVLALGGDFSVAGQKGKGAAVRVAIPLSEKE